VLDVVVVEADRDADRPVVGTDAGDVHATRTRARKIREKR